MRFRNSVSIPFPVTQFLCCTWWREWGIQIIETPASIICEGFLVDEGPQSEYIIALCFDDAPHTHVQHNTTGSDHALNHAMSVICSLQRASLPPRKSAMVILKVSSIINGIPRPFVACYILNAFSGIKCPLNMSRATKHFWPSPLTWCHPRTSRIAWGIKRHLEMMVTFPLRSAMSSVYVWRRLLPQGTLPTSCMPHIISIIMTYDVRQNQVEFSGFQSVFGLGRTASLRCKASLVTGHIAVM